MSTTAPPRWRTREPSGLGAASLQALFENEIPAIRIESFASAAECEQFARATGSFDELRGFRFIGVSQASYRRGGDRKDEYFTAVKAAAERHRSIFERSFNPAQRLADMIEPHVPSIGTATEDGYGEYVRCTIREASRGLHVHSDYAPFNAPNWAIGKIDAQITGNLYAQVTPSGGETTIYNHAWTPQDTHGERAQQGLPDVELPEETETFTFEPTVGDVVLFNSRNPHSVAGSDDGAEHKRISLGSFIGRMPDGRLVMWS